ncbi:hypothetical protein MILUP08_42646 [Micromonospora lupini str. Lupac 08]|uniref:Uncharacterized protein n=1 Tax=Micromonospora lupini str. Lupac 08 TaxID=1150864 RepID=I0L1L8_9ACTN|nr:hypothetical protein MILUP08_42646 [Micromonospora lupini str. Lupac 08]
MDEQVESTLGGVQRRVGPLGEGRHRGYSRCAAGCHRPRQLSRLIHTRAPNATWRSPLLHDFRNRHTYGCCPQPTALDRLLANTTPLFVAPLREIANWFCFSSSRVLLAGVGGNFANEVRPASACPVRRKAAPSGPSWHRPARCGSVP